MVKEKEKQVWTEVLELYRDMPCLWDAADSNYMNRDKRAEALDILLDKYKLIDEDADRTLLKRKIENLRTSYKRALKKAKESMNGDPNTDDFYRPTLWYFKLLTFLDDKNARRCRDGERSNEDPISPSTTRPVTTGPPPIKKQRTDFMETHEESIEPSYPLETPYKLESPYKSTNTGGEEEWEIVGKSIGIQMKDLDKRQQAIAQKLISDTLFYAKLGELSENSSISLRPTHPYHISMPSSMPSPHVQKME